MTSGAKVEFCTVRRNRPLSATNNCIDEAQLQLCYFAPLPELCSQKSNLLSCVARKVIVICFQKFNSPSGVVRKLAIICGLKSNLPSCVARKAAIICGQKFNSPSGVVPKLAMICGQKFNLPMLVLKHDVNSFFFCRRNLLYRRCYQAIATFKQGLTYLFNLLWLTSPQLLCPLGK